MSRVFRLHRQYFSTQNSTISPAERQARSQGRGASTVADTTRGVSKEEPSSRVKTTSTVLRLCEFCGSRLHKHRSECKASGQDCFYCSRHFSKICRQNPDNMNSDNTEIKQIDIEQYSGCEQSEYTTPYYLTNDQVKASVKCLKTTAQVHYIHNTDTKHIRPLSD